MDGGRENRFLAGGAEISRRGGGYSAAPVRTKDLTDDEIAQFWAVDGFYQTPTNFARAVIAADREKNK